MYLCVLYGLQLARPMCMVPNIPGIPGPPLGGSSSGSNSPSGYSIPSEAKMVSTSLALYFCLSICFFCLHFYPPGFLCTGLVWTSYDFLLHLLVYLTLTYLTPMTPHFVLSLVYRWICSWPALMLHWCLKNKYYCFWMWPDMMLFSCSVWRLHCPSRAHLDTVWESWPWAAVPWYLRGQNRASCSSSTLMLHHLHNLRCSVVIVEYNMTLLDNNSVS